jgi:glycosyltransferase involved in cell wall biosynthesis
VKRVEGRGVDDDVELTILMPCLNESATVGTCVEHARTFLTANGIRGEVLVADNGSTDGSQDIARAAGARVVTVPVRGYGAALIAGIDAARGTYVAMGDADDSYDFGSLGPFLERLRQGDDLVMGNRFAGGIAPGAMPALHKYIGNPVLSFVGRLLFRVPVEDFHCGLRAFRRDAIQHLQLRTEGMEFASEMVVKARLAELVISEQPTSLRPDGRNRPPHLRSWRDGWRHLRFLLLYSPRWLFLYPGLAIAVVGLLATTALTIGPVQVDSVGFDIGTLLFAIALTVVGYQGVIFAALSHVYALHEGFLPLHPRYQGWLGRVNLERSIAAGAAILLLGLVFSGISLYQWSTAGFGTLSPGDSVRAAAPGALGLILGSQTLMFGLFLSLLRIRVVPATGVDSAEILAKDAPLLASPGASAA